MTVGINNKIELKEDKERLFCDALRVFRELMREYRERYCNGRVSKDSEEKKLN